MPSTLYVWTCNEGGSQAMEVTPVGAIHPTCTGGQGSYVQVNVADVTAAANVDWDQVVWASGATLLMWAAGAGLGLIFRVAKQRPF